MDGHPFGVGGGEDGGGFEAVHDGGDILQRFDGDVHHDVFVLGGGEHSLEAHQEPLDDGRFMGIYD